jgi:hypothetical protein
MGSLNIVRAAAPPTFPAIYLAILMSLNPLWVVEHTTVAQKVDDRKIATTFQLLLTATTSSKSTDNNEAKTTIWLWTQNHQEVPRIIRFSKKAPGDSWSNIFFHYYEIILCHFFCRNRALATILGRRCVVKALCLLLLKDALRANLR